MLDDNPSFTSHIWSDEARFTRDGVVNRHNMLGTMTFLLMLFHERGSDVDKFTNKEKCRMKVLKSTNTHGLKEEEE